MDDGFKDSQESCASIDTIYSIFTFYLRGRIAVLVETPPFMCTDDNDVICMRCICSGMVFGALFGLIVYIESIYGIGC